MKILAIEKELKNSSSDEFAKHGKEEAKILWDLYQAGFVREFYFRADVGAAVLVLETDSTSAANEKARCHKGKQSLFILEKNDRK